MKKEKTSLRYLFEITGKSKWLLFLSAVFSVLSGICTFIPYIMVYEVLLFLFGSTPNTQAALQYSIYAIIAIVLKFLFMIVSGAFSHVGAFNTLYDIRCALSKHIAKINLGFFSTTSSGKLKKTIIEDTERIENCLAHQVPDIVKAVVVPIIMFIYMAQMNLQLSLMLLLPVFLGFVIQAIAMKVTGSYMPLYHKLTAKLNSSIMEFVNGMNVMKTFNMTAVGFKQYSDTVTEYNKFWVECSKAQGYTYGFFVVLVESGLMFVLPLGGWMYLQGTITLPVYLFFMVMSIIFLSSLKNLVTFAQSINQILTGVKRIQEILAIPVLESGELTITPEAVEEVTFENVHFSYGEQEVIHGIDLTLKKGTLTAFVGASGSGKTTTAQLVPRFWDVAKGKITINGIDESEIEEHNLMDLMSFVFQEAFMLNDTIRANIQIGKEDANEEQLYAAAQAAQIHDFILSLPKGYDTVLGDEGVKLSGGERQRICIARAILKDAPIVLFDEATSFTDVENERQIQLALTELQKNKTTVMIAHRLHTIRNADKICLFDDGRIVESGTHDELLAAKGRYYSMWKNYAKQGMEVAI